MNNSPSAAHARDLIARKDAIEQQMEAQFSILQSNGVNMDTPLLDPDGFPRADIDIWAVRHARVKIIELRNDRDALMNDIGLALQSVYDPATLAREPPASSAAAPGAPGSEPFAKVDGVAPGSPAAAAVRLFCFTDIVFTGTIRRDCDETTSFCRLDLSPTPRFPLRHYNR